TSSGDRPESEISRISSRTRGSSAMSRFFEAVAQCPSNSCISDSRIELQLLFGAREESSHVGPKRAGFVSFVRWQPVHFVRVAGLRFDGHKLAIRESGFPRSPATRTCRPPGGRVLIFRWDAGHRGFPKATTCFESVVAELSSRRLPAVQPPQFGPFPEFARD